MYNSNIIQLLNSQKVRTQGKELLELIKMFVALPGYKYCRNEVDASYIFGCVFKGQTVIDIGAHKGRYLYRMLRRVGSMGKVIVFETQPFLYNYLTRISALLNWKNIKVETASFCGITNLVYQPDSYSSSQGTSVINFNDAVFRRNNEAGRLNTLDHYCTTHNLRPDFIKIDLADKELKVLYGAREIVEKNKPVFIIRCEESTLGRQKMLEIFKFFIDQNYKGSFIFDTMKLPLENFEFDLYQNPRSNFYCSYFVFE
jgi:FkbM family methyltransferase